MGSREQKTFCRAGVALGLGVASKVEGIWIISPVQSSIFVAVERAGEKDVRES